MAQDFERNFLTGVGTTPQDIPDGSDFNSDDTLIGIGSTILNKSKIGKNCIIGANTLIPENKVIPDRSLVLGSPGKIIREVTNKEIEEIKVNARHYVENYKRYKK